MKHLIAFIKKKIKSELKWNSLWVIMATASSAIAVLAIFAVTNVTNMHYNQSIDEATLSNNTQIVDNVSKSIDGYLEEMVNVSNLLAKYFKKNGGAKNTKDSLPFIPRSDINTIAAFDSQGKLMLKSSQKSLKSTAVITSQNWFRSLSPGSQDYYISAPHVQSLYQGEYPWVLSLSKGFLWTEDKKIVFGTILVDLNFKNIQELCSNELGQKGYIYILGAEDELIYHPKQQMIYYGIHDMIVPCTKNLAEGNSIIIVNDQRVSVCVKKLNNVNWRIVGVSRLNGMSSYDTEIKNFVTLIIVASVLSVTVLSILISLFTTRPIRGLIKLMGKVEAGEMDTFAEANGSFEVKEL